MSDKEKQHLLVTSGDGPAECRLAVTRILRRMAREAADLGLEMDVERPDGAEEGDPASAIVILRGKGAVALGAGWTGTVLWTATSPFRPHHKRRNWFAGVFALEVLAGGSEAVRPDDVLFEAFRAGGPGGQHQNTTDSAVRATHLPTGISVVSREHRSQHRNRQASLDRLTARMLLLRDRQRSADQSSRNRLHRKLERGNPVRCFKGEKFREV